MRSFWSDPYLWIHLAGIAVLPLWLELCFLGLAVGDPIFPVWLELALVAIAGIAPVLWMQWQRPFYIFSLLAIALKPENLTLPQRQLLTRFRSPQNRLLAVAVAILLAITLRQLYVLAPIGAAVAPFSIESRGLGLLLAAIAFLGSNLFLQVPVSVASVMLTSDSAFASTEPYPLDQISQYFTRLGLPVSQLLPEVVSLKDSAIASPVISSPVTQDQAPRLDKLSSDDDSLDIWGDLSETELPKKTTLEFGNSESEQTSLADLTDLTEVDLPKTSPLESISSETEAINPPEIDTVEVNGISLQQPIDEIEAIAAISDLLGEVDLPEVNLPIESGDEVEQDSLEDSAAIARIDEQSTVELSSIEEFETSESESGASESSASESEPLV
ncbi:low-complexity tail membrane protein [Phormidium sp. CLA17]|uniref:low-complexity tail membrane protein n=1 Tax=Leptolyngbya sp. Cla-17 TaxID=2803751 RepID=UPI001490D8D3|nr:low-complexity tail membrane protein [Leptolyngbya sp. Cla-17]MBM0740561.1 low-complexity tail membrane protein [Leptolyngbya sp. Cla-17]